MNNMQNYIIPNWSAPKNVHAYVTLRNTGYSKSPYASFNLASHVGDDQQAVLQNRHKLAQDLQLSNQPYWLQQAHTNKAIAVDYAYPEPIADASYTSIPNQVCAILTADCLPLLICNTSGSIVAAIHAGWKGLAAGVIEATLKSVGVDRTNCNDFMVWLGPAIGPSAFEVGDDTRELFVQQDKTAEAAFTKKENHKWNCNIYLLAKLRLYKFNLINIYGGDFCTFLQADKFFSFRRDQGITGRMASIIWIS